MGVASARAVSKPEEGRGLQVSSETRTRVDAWKTLKKLQKLARLLRKFFVEKFTLTVYGAIRKMCIVDTIRKGWKEKKKKISRKLKVENFKPSYGRYAAISRDIWRWNASFHQIWILGNDSIAYCLVVRRKETARRVFFNPPFISNPLIFDLATVTKLERC